MLTEGQRQELAQNLHDNVDFRYPTSSGANQYDFNIGNVKTVYFAKEPYEMHYPAMKVEVLPSIQTIGGGINYYYTTVSGVNVYAYGELQPVIITCYTHQQCEGDSGTGYHGKIVADSLIRRTELHVKRYWPSLLSGMEASLRISMGFPKTNIANVLHGTERQGFEMTFYIVTTNKWDYLIGDTPSDTSFNDAIVSGMDQASYDAGDDYSTYRTISGIIGI